MSDMHFEMQNLLWFYAVISYPTGNSFQPLVESVNAAFAIQRLCERLSEVWL